MEASRMAHKQGKMWRRNRRLRVLAAGPEDGHQHALCGSCFFFGYMSFTVKRVVNLTVHGVSAWEGETDVTRQFQ